MRGYMEGVISRDICKTVNGLLLPGGESTKKGGSPEKTNGMTAAVEPDCGNYELRIKNYGFVGTYAFTVSPQIRNP